MQLQQLMARYDLDAHELHLLVSLLYVSLPGERIVRHAAKESDAGDLLGASSVADCRNALARLLARGLVQNVSARSLHGMRLIVQRRCGIGPVSGWPNIGHIDLTEEGAKIGCLIIRGISHESDEYGWSAIRRVCDKHVQLFNISRKAVLNDLAELNPSARPQISVTGPVSIGPWRDRWWLEFSRGARIDIRGEIDSISFGHLL